MLVFDKQEIRDSLSIDDIYNLLDEWGGEPERCPTGLIARTICHNHLEDEASRKLYYYENTGLFRCYTGCEEPIFDVFQLCIKVMNLQKGLNYDLNDAVRWIAYKFGLSGREENNLITIGLEDWKLLDAHSRIEDIRINTPVIVLKEYNKEILSRLNYSVKLKPWLDEGISQDILTFNQIGFYPGGDQITIPHFDKDGRFIGLRGRTLSEDEAVLYGKYRPISINGQMYNHPLGLNLYNFNHAKEHIKIFKTAIIFEGEKSVLKAQTYFGLDADIYVACCGSSISSYQIELLKEAGAQEIIIAFDRQFQYVGDDEYIHLKKNLMRLINKYKNDVRMTCIIDSKKLTGYKDSPIDCGPEIFLRLYNERKDKVI